MDGVGSETWQDPPAMERLREPLVNHRKEACRECWGCVRVCPVKAIRVVSGRSEVIQEKCIACGLCVNECGAHSHMVRDDTPAVMDLLRSRRPVVVLLATEFIAALHPLTVSQIERALISLGFHSIETTLLGEEIVAQEYERLHAREDALFILRSTCPVVVDYVRKFYPALTPALAPVVPPFVAQARLIRSLYPADTAIVYVSPCFSRKDEIFDRQFEGVIDAAIDFTELKRLIADSEQQPVRGRVTEQVPHRPGVLKEISLTDGFPRHTLVSRDMTDPNVLTVRGIESLDRLLRAMVSGEAAPEIVDMLMCEGCIDGPAVNPGLSLFAKRNVESAAREMPGTTRVSTRALLAVLPSVPLVRSFEAEPVRIPRPASDQVDAVLAEGGFASRADSIDCGACGFGTCVEHAEAIFRGDSSWVMCFPLQRRRLEHAEQIAAATVTLDEITGLWNRRGFTDRLKLEMDRHVRYKSPLSLLLLDLDGFGRVNDVIGEAGGDTMLAHVGEIFSRNLRTTDLAARFHGDQFAVLLPGVPKTAAFAVAEKLRTAVREASFGPAEGYTTDVSMTISVGVATAGAAVADPMTLIEAADTALREAAAIGSDQVRLAPG
ncbi:MAG: diguanylate cyclase domain-containing protein [Coriobacteriia bacterium]